MASYRYGTGTTWLAILYLGVLEQHCLFYFFFRTTEFQGSAKLKGRFSSCLFGALKVPIFEISH